MIPIFDAIGEHLSTADIKELIQDQKIITLPLAYMRGTTFKKAFVLLDEAQNTTSTQIHLFLTRIGQNSKMVITGDVTQSDLGPQNGFVDALDRLHGVEGIGFVHMPPRSIVRHPIIEHINSRYGEGKGTSPT